MVDEGPPAGEARPSSAGSKQTGSSQITKPGRSMVTRQAARVKRWVATRSKSRAVTIR